MSYTVRVEIRCDAPGCKTAFALERKNRGGLSKTWAGFVAVKAGWDITGHETRQDPKRAFCPEHDRRKA